MAEDLVRGVAQQQASSARKSAVGLLVGGIAIVGCVLTYASYSAAASRAGGGTYYVCTGIILLGIYMAIRGGLQLIRGRE